MVKTFAFDQATRSISYPRVSQRLAGTDHLQGSDSLNVLAFAEDVLEHPAQRPP
jgi:hypothetical protein